MPSPWTVPFDPVLIGAAVTAITLAAFIGYRSEGPTSRWRPAATTTAAVLLVACWVSPLQTVASHYLLSGHLLQITLVMGVIPPLFLLGLPERCSIRLPRTAARLLRLCVHPVAGMVAVNLAFFAWHSGPAYDLALQSPEVYAAQQVSLLLASVMFWWPIVVPLGDRRVLSRWGTLGYILVATIPQTFAGITVALVRHPLYALYGQAPRLFGLGVLTDQQIAGACIALVSKIALFTAFSVVFLRMLNEPTSDGDDDDGGGGGGGGRRPTSNTPSPLPSGSVPWLTDLNAGRTVPEPAPAPRPLRVPAVRGPGRG
ncbi:MAG: cytochrome c oxidase assembly protein [Candidatus Dormibacteraeota bacterium]|nr:cytochrome c oxidase assembly protein [Candidatus Dormibacteraeota bacterium]